MKIHHNFLKTAINANVLKFGKFILKSGRISPYFFNAGLFDNGKFIYEIAHCYADKIIEKKIKFEILFGPAYKGIALSAVVASILFIKYNVVIGFCFNRKEKKDHGEKGRFIGASFYKKRVLIIDDVITSGSSIQESINMIKEKSGNVIGICIGLDRQEMILQKELKIYSIATITDLIEYMYLTNIFETKLLISMKNYHKQYGIKNKE